MSPVHGRPDKASQEASRCVFTYSEFFSHCVLAGCARQCVCEVSGGITRAQLYIPDARKWVKSPGGRTPEAK